MTQMRDALAEFFQQSRQLAERQRDIGNCARSKTLQCGLLGKSRVFGAIFADHAAQVAAQRHDEDNPGHDRALLCSAKSCAVGVCDRLTGEVIRKPSVRK